MKLEKIISLANKTSELRFLAMVRSLRTTGCNLPVWVIPYDNNKFDLPDNCVWWEMDEVIAQIDAGNLHRMNRKFQCFFTNNYQFVDADIVFLTDPQKKLAQLDGFITSCCHWNNPFYTYVPSTLKIFKEKSTTWQKSVFNAGQFACDKVLCTLDELKENIQNPLYKEAWDTHDQMTINLFVFLSAINVTNITLPPYNMESTWAGDYTDENYTNYWVDEKRKPYLIHWAGCKMDTGRPIDKLFLDYLNAEEKVAWERFLIEQQIKYSPPTLQKRVLSKLKRIFR